MLNLGMGELTMSFIFQIVNTVLLIAFGYLIIFLIRNLITLPRKIRERNEKIDRLEKKVDEIYKKLKR